MRARTAAVAHRCPNAERRKAHARNVLFCSLARLVTCAAAGQYFIIIYYWPVPHAAQIAAQAQLPGASPSSERPLRQGMIAATEADRI